MLFFKSLLDDLWSVLFPKVCLLCGRVVSKSESGICIYCRDSLPFTDFDNLTDNALTQLMAGRCDLQYAASLFYSHRSSLTRQLLYQLKYKSQENLGILFGQWLGERLLNTTICEQIDFVLPVPIHPKRLRKRGYNQSARFAQTLSRYIDADYNSKLLLRMHHGASQVFKSRWERWSKDQNAFSVSHPNILQGKHILLVDDLITTGNTLQNCIESLSNIPGIRISIAVIAMAR